jgi:hypothetical protein
MVSVPEMFDGTTPSFSLMWIYITLMRIRLFNLMQVRIQIFTMMQTRIQLHIRVLQSETNGLQTIHALLGA